MFIPTDFWQPDRDQWKSLATLGALVLAALNVGLMRVIWTQAFGLSGTTYRRLTLSGGVARDGVGVIVGLVSHNSSRGSAHLLLKATRHQSSRCGSSIPRLQ